MATTRKTTSRAKTTTAKKTTKTSTKAAPKSAAKTTTTKTSKAKTATPTTATTAAKAAAAASATQAAPTPTVVKDTAPVVGVLPLRKKELIDSVVARSGIKKKDAKPAIEAMLAILGETIAEGRELQLPPMGKLKINRTKQLAKARVVVCKLRQSNNSQTPSSDPVADAAE